MARMQVSFSVEGDVQVVSMFDAARGRARNLRVPFRRIGDMMLGYIDDNYSTHGGVWGRWKRRAQSYPWPLLEQTGQMRDSFYKKVGRDYVELGNEDPRDIFKFHQSKRPRSSTLPRRIMMAVQEDQRREAMKILQEHVMEG